MMRRLGQILQDIAQTPGIHQIRVHGTYFEMGRGELIFDQTYQAASLANSQIEPPEGMTPTVEVVGAVGAHGTDILAALNENRKQKGLKPFPGTLVVATTQPAAGKVIFRALFND